MSKFKIGDRVVLVRITSTKDKPLHTVFTISGEMGQTHTTYGKAYSVIPSDIGYYEKQLELEHVFNSPLYQALS